MATSLTRPALNRPLLNWLLQHPAVRRFASGKGHHAEAKHDAHGHGDHHHDPRHFEGPGEGMPFPTYPSHKFVVGVAFWGYLFAPIGAGILCLERAKASK